MRVRRRAAAPLGFVLLCADRRFHRQTMEAFEHAAGLSADRYWIEATVGGAPGQALRPRGADYVFFAAGRRVTRLA